MDSAANFGWTPGEFSVSHDGAAGYTVPLWTPTGRGSVTPKLALSYNSGAGNGFLGVGWALNGLSSVTWCGRTIAQDGYTDGGHFDGSDGLCLDGNRLVPVSPPFSPQTEYRTEVETFSKIVAYNTQDNVPDYFRMYAKDGTILTFGGDPNARVQPYKLYGTGGDGGPALAREVTAPRVTTGWVLDRVEDRNGNAATVEYTRTEGDAAEQWWMELRPARVNYAPNREVRFVYDPEGRPDELDQFSGGTHTRTVALISSIEMWGGSEGEPAEMLRQYRMKYSRNSITGRSLLTSVSECDPDDKCKVSLPFQYSLGSYEFEEVDMGESDVTPVSVADVNGDGLSDILVDDKTRRMLRHAYEYPTTQGARFVFADPRESGLPGSSTMQILDIDADGRSEVLAEVLEQRGGQNGYRYQIFRPEDTEGGGWSYEPVDGRLGRWRKDTFGPQRVYLADLDGTGSPDFIGTQVNFEGPWAYRLNTGASGANRFAPDEETNVFGGSAISNFAVDSNGDGLTELVSYADSNYWKSWGLVPSEIPGEWQVQDRPLYLQGEPTTTHFGDVNGDGLVDAVLPHGLAPDGPVGLRVQLNSGNGFGSPLTTPSPSPYNGPPVPGFIRDVGVRIADFNGDGRDDILNLGERAVYVWGNNEFTRVQLNIDSSLGPSGVWESTQLLDLNGDGVLDIVNAGADDRLRVYQRKGGVPDRLIGVGSINTRGRTEISYTTLSEGAQRPGGNYSSPPVHTPGSCTYPLTCPTSGGTIVASHAVTSDFGPGYEISWDSYSHSYMGARADLHGRGWLGFAEHRVTQADTLASTVTEFDNASPDSTTNSYPYARLPRSETYTVRVGEGSHIREYRRVTERHFEVRHHDVDSYNVEERLTIAAEDERDVRTAEWESLRLTKTVSTFDEFGNPDVVATKTTGGRSLTQDFDYRNNTSDWLLGFTTRSLSKGCTNDGRCSTRESTYDYDDKGNPLVVEVEPNNPAMRLTTTTVFGDVGEVESITRTDDAGVSRVETFEYSDADKLYPTATINAAGHRTEFERHSGLGVPLRVTDPNGVPTTFRYDHFGRLREVNQSDGAFEHITHSTGLGHLFGLPYRQSTTTTNASGGETTELVDQLGRQRERQVKTFDGRLATTHTDYDTLGRGVWRTSRPALPDEALRVTEMQHDNLGRVTSVTAADGSVVRHEYVNLETHTYDAKGVHSFTINSADGDVVSRYECATVDKTGCADDESSSPDWLITDFGYGPFGERTSTLFRPDGTAQITRYDRLGRPDRVQMSSSGVTDTTYNAFGEISSVTDAEQRVTTFDEYDALGRVRKQTSPDGVTTFDWDTAANGIGKLDESHSSDGVTIGHTYDDVGKRTTTTWTIEGARYGFGYGYDEFGRPDCISYPMIPGATGASADERLTVGQVYNANGYLAQVTHGCETGGEKYWIAEAQNGAGQLESERLGNGVTTSLAYQPTTGLLDTVETVGPGTVGTLAEIGYVYDDNRNVTERNDHVGQRFETYDYDVLNRLSKWSIRTGPAPVSMNTTYTYDPAGNLMTETLHRPEQPEATTIYRYGENGAPPHWLTSRDDRQYRYDSTGQQIGGPDRTVDYNTAGLPSVLNWNDGGGEARRTEFAYDANGARVLKRDSDQTVVTVNGLLERRTTAGAGGETDNLHNIVVDGRVIAQVNRAQSASGVLNMVAQVTYLHRDLQGSTVALSNDSGEPASAGGPSMEELLYDPFGRRVGAGNETPDDSRREGSRVGFTGHEHDDELGLINMQGRIYDPEARRFLTPDPIQPAVSSQTLNRYSYVKNNPTTLIDPTGFVWDPPDGDGWGGSGSATGPYNPGPFSGRTGPIFPGGSFGCTWLCGILNGALNATPGSGEPTAAPSSDDGVSGTDVDDAAPEDSTAAGGDDDDGGSDGGGDGGSDGGDGGEGGGGGEGPSALEHFGAILDVLGAVAEGTGAGSVGEVAIGLVDAVVDMYGGLPSDEPAPDGLASQGYALFKQLTGVASAAVAYAAVQMVVTTGISILVATEVVALMAPVVAAFAAAGTVVAVGVSGYLAMRSISAGTVDAAAASSAQVGKVYDNYVVPVAAPVVYEVERGFRDWSMRGQGLSWSWNF